MRVKFARLKGGESTNIHSQVPTSADYITPSISSGKVRASSYHPIPYPFHVPLGKHTKEVERVAFLYHGRREGEATTHDCITNSGEAILRSNFKGVGVEENCCKTYDVCSIHF